MDDQYGTLTITMTVYIPNPNSDMFKLRDVPLAKVYIPRTMVEEYVRDFKGCNPSLCDANLLRGTFTPEPENFSLTNI